MSGTPIVGQEHFRFRSDTGTVDNASPTWLAAEDTNITMTLTTVPFRLRIGLQNTGTGTQAIQLLAMSKNGGSYTPMGSTAVTAHSSASSDIDNTAVTTTNFRLSAMSGGKQAGRYDSNGAISLSLSSLQNVEVEFGLSLVLADLTNGDTLDFRMFGAGSTSSPLSSYDVTPRITIGTGTTNEVIGQIVL